MRRAAALAAELLLYVALFTGMVAALLGCWAVNAALATLERNHRRRRDPPGPSSRKGPHP